MKKITLLIFVMGLLIINFAKAQEVSDTTKVTGPNNENTTTVLKTDYGVIRIPGLWTKFSYENESKQSFLKNDEGAILGVALTPKKLYSFYKPTLSNSEIVEEFFKWEYEYRVGAGFKTSKIKVNSTNNYIVWKFTENNIDNVFLYSIKSDLLSNFVIYTDKWDENKKILFLEKINSLNL